MESEWAVTARGQKERACEGPTTFSLIRFISVTEHGGRWIGGVMRIVEAV
jgi:hypothetical protein